MPSTKPTPIVLPRLIPLKRAAVETGLSHSSLRDAHFRGELAIMKMGRAWYVEIAELAKFVERQTERRKAG